MAEINTRQELIEKYVEFFKNHKEFPHKEIPNASLIPENDPTVLFTTAGMHPLVPFLLGQKHPQGNKLTNVQKCIRTGDIEEVGDSYHHTFFEMLGNWSLGDYWKKETINLSFEFLTEVLKIPKEKLAVTCFVGDKENNIPKDTESAEIWKSVGIPKERIAFTKKDNWWGPAGKTGPCGPDTEIFYWKPKKTSPPKKFDPEDEENWVEIWNDVLMQYSKDSKGNFREAKQKNIDTGMGVERTVAVLNGLEDDYLTRNFLPIIRKIEEISDKKYEENKKIMRVIADHIKASVMILSEGIKPSNTEQGYILRRLIRRGINYGRKLNIHKTQTEESKEKEDKLFTKEIAGPIFEIYTDYGDLQKNKENILEKLEKEEKRFNQKINQGMKVFDKIAKNNETQRKKEISGKDAFLLYQSYGFPIEMTIELAKERGAKVDKQGFDEEYRKHQELSRTASAGKFKSGLADNSEQTKKLHTATHMLNEALRQVLNDRDIQQKGSNINPERLRFDFNFPRKLTKEELQKVEDLINEKIQDELPVTHKEMTVEEAKSLGAAGVFNEKYGNMVKVYFIGPKEPEEQGKNKKLFSVEICAGPHVENTRELGKFKIKKEESSSAGVRRIKAVLKDSL